MNITTILVTIVFLLVIFILPILSSHFRKNKNLILIYYFVVLLYQIVAFTNAFWFRTIGADMDANSFHVMAVEMSNSSVFYVTWFDTKLYINILSFLYWLTQPSHIIGEQLSILSISISMIILVNIIDLLKLNKFQTPLVFLYAALPSMVALGAITLREPLEIFLLISAIYFGLKMRIYPNKKILNFCFFLLFCFLMGIFHRGLFVYGSILVGTFLIWNINKNKNKNIFIINKYRFLILVITPILLITLAYLGGNSNISGAELFRAVASFDILEAIEKHRSVTPIGRASYDVPFDASSFIAVIYSSFLIYLNYLFAPFIWQVSSLTDIYAYLESVAYVILVYYSIKSWRLAKGQTHQLLGMMLFLFFILSFMFALGTTNYGTGMRHKIITWWMLVLIGGPLFYSDLRLILYKLNITNKYQNV